MGGGGLLSWKSRQEDGSGASGNPGERGGGEGLKNDPIRQGCVVFFLEQPIQGIKVIVNT